MQFTFDDVKSSDFDALPDGEYIFKMKEATVTLNKPTWWGDDKGEFPGQVSMKILVDTGNFKGRMVFKNYTLSGFPKQLLKQDLEVLGMELGKVKEIEDLAEICAGLENMKFHGKLKTNKAKNGKDYQNCYINSLLEKKVTPDFDTDEEIPF